MPNEQQPAPDLIGALCTAVGLLAAFGLAVIALTE
jgi:hypothetical protein